METTTKVHHMIGTTGVAECGQRLGHADVQHIAKSAAGLLSWAEQYGDTGQPAPNFWGPEVCPKCVRHAATALARRGRTDLIPERFVRQVRLHLEDQMRKAGASAYDMRGIFGDETGTLTEYARLVQDWLEAR